MKIAPAIAQLVELEQQVSLAAKEADPLDEMRVYEWRPHGIPELPAIWNWIEPGTVETVDTGRIDDVLIVKATIGVKPSDIAESMGQLVRLTDVFREVADPVLWRNGRNPPLAGTVRESKRISTHTEYEDFDGIPVMCMDMLIRLQLSHFVS